LNRLTNALPLIIAMTIVLFSVLVVSRGTSATSPEFSGSTESLSAAPVCRPEQLLMVLEPSKDNTLYEVDQSDPMLSNGKGQYLFSGYTNDSSVGVRRGLIAFDLTGHILRSATVLSATLEMNLSKSHFFLPVADIELHKVLKDWGEGASDALGEEGVGILAENDDATWFHNFYDMELWDQPGGDFVATITISQTVSSVGWYTWGPSEQMVDDIQGWVEEPDSNFGWVLIGDEELLGTAKRFDSRENQPENRPRLKILYMYEDCSYLPLVIK
jgi:hypothetical protein